jgi:actin-like ATPase involved in cell morphogenesis
VGALEPSVVAIDERSGSVQAVGEQARRSAPACRSPNRSNT